MNKMQRINPSNTATSTAELANNKHINSKIPDIMTVLAVFRSTCMPTLPFKTAVSEETIALKVRHGHRKKKKTAIIAYHNC